MHDPVRTMLACAVLVAAIGCFERVSEQEAGAPPEACVFEYVSIHFSGAGLDTAALRDAFQASGYVWRETSVAGVANLTPGAARADSDVAGVVSFTPGVSGIGENATLILSWIELEGGSAAAVRAEARRSAAIVNETFPEVEIVRWIEGQWTSCAPFDEIVADRGFRATGPA